MTNFKNTSLLFIALILGLSIHGYLMGRSLERFKKEDRSISVKGFAEREVKANLAVWNIKTRITTNDILEGNKSIQENKQKIMDFLQAKGIQPQEIIQQNFNVTDKLAREYVGTEMGPYRYIIENTLQVRTPHVEIIEQVSRLTDELLKAGVMIAENTEYNPAVKYLFTELNRIKPEMLTEATQNAKKAAQEFTKENQVKLGALKKANQGLFTITDRDVAALAGSSDPGYYSPSVSDLIKKVRVVVNIEYSVD